MKRASFLLLLSFFLIKNLIHSEVYFKYIVERYDTTRTLSEQFKVQEYDIIKKNVLDGKPYLFVGQVLYIPVTYIYRNPKLSGLTAIMNNSTTNWRNPTFELYRWDKSPNVLIFDTYNYSFQSLMFKRLAFFVEKKDFIGSIYSLAELEGEKGWNGHDYKADDLAAFFNKVNYEGFSITRGEEILLDILLKNRILEFSEIGYVGIGGAVISCSRSSYYNHRKTILRHEAFHGLYFTSPEFRAYAKSVWDGLDKLSAEIWILYLNHLEYDTSDSELIINEFMAYMLQQSEDETYQYLNNIVFYRLYYEYPDKRFSINSFFSNNRTPYHDSIKSLREYTEKLLIE